MEASLLLFRDVWLRWEWDSQDDGATSVARIRTHYSLVGGACRCGTDVSAFITNVVSTSRWYTTECVKEILQKEDRIFAKKKKEE